MMTCPKCSGTLYLDQDSFGTFAKCVQCGLLKDISLVNAPSSHGNLVKTVKLLSRMG